MNYKIKKVSGDASFRKFYRLEENRKSSILVFAEKERFKNLIIYIIVNKILNLNKVPAPKLIKECYKKNYIKITDLGDKSFYSFVKEKKSKFSYYRKLIDGEYTFSSGMIFSTSSASNSSGPDRST